MATSDSSRKPLLLCLGGGGGNVAEHLLTSRQYAPLLQAIDLVCANTDAQSLSRNSAHYKIQLGDTGLGSGSKPEIGRRSVEQSRSELAKHILGRDLLVIVATLGGGTGSGASPFVADLAKSQGAKVVFVGTLPFKFEGKHQSVAAEARDRLISVCDGQFILPNDLPIDLIGNDASMLDAFKGANEVLCFALQRALAPESSQSLLRSALARSNEYADWSNLLPLLEDWERQAAGLFGRGLISAAPSIITLRTQSELLSLARDPRHIHTITPRRFEELMYALYRAAGLRAELTKQARDDGVDLLVWTPGSLFGSEFLTVVQLKRFTGNTKVGSPAIRELKGTQSLFDADRAECITTTSFTKSARDTAAELSIDLAEFAHLCRKIDEIVRK